jgi:hypothetical protein
VTAPAQSLKEHNAAIDLANRSIFEQLDGQPLFADRSDAVCLKLPYALPVVQLQIQPSCVVSLSWAL